MLNKVSSKNINEKIASIVKKMVNNHEDVLEDADLLEDAEDIQDKAEDNDVDYEDVKDFIESLEDDKDCRKEMKRLIEKLKVILDSDDNEEEVKNFDLADILSNHRFRYINSIYINLVAINSELSKINNLDFFLTHTVNERDFILIKPSSYSKVEKLFFIGLDKLTENICCPVCKNKTKFSQYIKTSAKLVTVCNECSHIINLEEEF